MGIHSTELKVLVGLHQYKQGGADALVSQQEGLTEDEVRIIKGAMELKEKKVEDVYCPLEDVFMMEFNEKLDKKRINNVRSN
jgi:CBS domain containing-hemolysin-like protein